MRLAFALIAACAVVVACSHGLPPEEASHIETSARASAAAYRHASDGGAEAILIKTAHCEDQAVIRDMKLPAYDAGIGCPK